LFAECYIYKYTANYPLIQTLNDSEQAVYTYSTVLPYCNSPLWCLH